MSDETPTESMPSAEQAKSANSRTALIVVSIIAGILLLAVTVLLTLFLSGLGKTDEQPAPSLDPSPSASVEPSESPSASAEPEGEASAAPSEQPTETTTPPAPPPPPPPATGPVFTAFSPANNKSVGCSSSGDSVPVTFTWTSTGANEAAFGVGTTDAFAGPLETGLPASGSYTWNYQCGNATQLYTVSIKGASGQTNKTITLKY